jgi:hypothetical protein
MNDFIQIEKLNEESEELVAEAVCPCGCGMCFCIACIDVPSDTGNNA